MMNRDTSHTPQHLQHTSTLAHDHSHIGLLAAAQEMVVKRNLAEPGKIVASSPRFYKNEEVCRTSCSLRGGSC